MCDASWGEDIDNRKSQAGFVFTMGDTAVSWKSYKLSDVSRSTPEAEYCACLDTAAEARGLTNLLTELGFAPELPIKIPTDNQGAQAMIANTANRRRTKHIDIRYHFVLDYFLFLFHV